MFHPYCTAPSLRHSFALCKCVVTHLLQLFHLRVFNHLLDSVHVGLRDQWGAGNVPSSLWTGRRPVTGLTHRHTQTHTWTLTRTACLDDGRKIKYREKTHTDKHTGERVYTEGPPADPGRQSISKLVKHLDVNQAFTRCNIRRNVLLTNRTLFCSQLLCCVSKATVSTSCSLCPTLASLKVKTSRWTQRKHRHRKSEAEVHKSHHVFGCSCSNC